MIRGQVTAIREAIVPLQLRGLTGQVESVMAVIDTGFTGGLALPATAVTRLGMPFRMLRSYQLGDGTIARFDIHQATVIWDGADRQVDVLVTAGGTLIGMALLLGHELFMDVIDGGEVRITRRP